MGRSLDQLLEKAVDGDIINVTIVSNEDDGIATFATGGLTYNAASVSVFSSPSDPNFVPFRPAGLTSDASQPFDLYFSDRKIDVDPPTPPLGHLPRQPFNVNASEKLSVAISLGTTRVMRLSVFGTRTSVVLNDLGDLLVGLGPSLGNSAGGVFAVAFTGISRPPTIT